MTYLVATPESTDTEELIRVLVWRFKQLCRSGFELELATTIAARMDVDLHEAIDLVDQGCPPDVAGRIVL
jgi:hypothetical protein